MLAFDNITCAGQVSESFKKPTNVVKDVTGYAESGALTAVVGASRAGNSAFLSALAGEEDPTVGKIFYKGNEVSAMLRRHATGYCWFGAEHVVWHGTTTLVLFGGGSPCCNWGGACILSKHTSSGLDANSVQRIIHVLEQVARIGRTVMCSMPDSESSAFDRVLLLSSNGETIFHGKTCLMVQYLRALPGVKRSGSGKTVITWALESLGKRSGVTTATARGCEARMDTKKKKGQRGGLILNTIDIVNSEKETRFVWSFQRSETRKRLLSQMQRVGYLHPHLKEQHVPGLIAAYKSGNLRAQAASWHMQIRWLMRREILSYWCSLFLLNSVATTMQWQLLVLIIAFIWFVWVCLPTRSTEYDTFDGVNHGIMLIAWSTLLLGASFALSAIAWSGHRNAWRENAYWCRERAWRAYLAVICHVCSIAVELAFVLGITLVAAMVTFTLLEEWQLCTLLVPLAIFALG
ncbi:unnamed protein product [Peronospora belbahrii]|uniref:ABC transporter domain-containing protein n=1 Tax=Peronospora belbahrii TaxID=622444 RepID=A0ABN8CP14_9STRA|nr:unnamed protein product [Peronospora belbahrii]